MSPRKLTEEEKRELVDYVAKRMYLHPTEKDIAEAREVAEEWLEGSAAAVFDHYITESPGYAGKLLVVVWPAGPSITETYIWRDGQIVNVPIETNVREEEQFNHEELQAIEETFHDALKDAPEDKLYQSIHEKAEKLAYGG